MPATGSSCGRSVKYMWLLIAPIKLSCDYSFDSIPAVISTSDPRVALAALSYCLLFALALYLGRQGQWQALFAVAWGGALFVPAAGLLFDVGTVIGERLLFLPSAAFCLLCALGAARLTRTTANSVIIALVLSYSVRSVIRNATWADSLTLWQATAEEQPRNAKALFNLGVTLRNQQGDGSELQPMVMDLYSRALAIKPDYDNVYMERAKMYLRHGMETQARADLEQAASISDHPDAHFHLGLLKMQRGKDRCAEAERHFLIAIAREPYDHRAHTNMGICRHWHHHLQEAHGWLTKALSITPAAEAAVPADALANVLRDSGLPVEAAKLHDLATAIQPQSFAFQYNRALSLFEAEEFSEAAAAFKLAATLDPAQATLCHERATFAKQFEASK
ncbi:hypothetical protein CYMTET_28645 [Cymbomonas tetramitiformis]|uniref:dolichyl-phosphate-mannose--protein mannosyltransferase n=1 Tax=Cymbomonas tetramitiformis TaxID=36881 RepID=A0AAE0KVP5_9CHLO|nr:hypothetical protein CYMTET_28645 [Cymbomonas tetramitiformis]